MYQTVNAVIDGPGQLDQGQKDFIPFGARHSSYFNLVYVLSIVLTFFKCSEHIWHIMSVHICVTISAKQMGYAQLVEARA